MGQKEKKIKKKRRKGKRKEKRAAGRAVISREHDHYK